ncbi:MAG: hypothetical protein EPN82_11205 [Bacteroidetes bacterium]|nr:MAG: hypothetical protein EPN82_11205 [Bacteroidota bacterium]
MKSNLLLCFLVLIILTACNDKTFTEEPIPTGFTEYNCFPWANFKEWKSEDSPYGLFDVYFVSRRNGWVLMKKDSILNTTNGGKTWTKNYIETIDPGLNYDNYHFICVYFIDDFNGWVGASSNRLYHSTDRGVHWSKTLLFYNVVEGGIYNIQFTDNQTGWATLSDEKNTKYLIKTTDAGATWQIVNSSEVTGYSSLTFVDKNIAYCFGDYSNNNMKFGAIYKTTDEGISWEKVFSDSSVTFNKIFFINPNTGWALTKSNKFFKTTDGGETWYIQYFNNNSQIINFTFSDELNGWLVTGLPIEITGDSKYYLIYHTDNGGNTWLPLNYWVALDEPNGIVHFHDLFFFDKDEGFISGSKGVILHTTTGGKQ